MNSFREEAEKARETKGTGSLDQERLESGKGGGAADQSPPQTYEKSGGSAGGPAGDHDAAKRRCLAMHERCLTTRRRSGRGDTTQVPAEIPKEPIPCGDISTQIIQ